jgi:hypothetical protein
MMRPATSAARLPFIPPNKKASRFGSLFANLSWALLGRRLEMGQGFFSVLSRDIRMSLFAMINGRIEVRDALCCMRIVFCLLGRRCVLESGLGMGDEDIRMSLFAVLNGLLRMLYGFGQVIFCADDTRGHQEGGSKAKDQCKSSAVHGCSSLFFPFLKR